MRGNSKRIDVEPDEPSARLHAFQDRARVTAAAERAIDSHLARAGPQAADDFVHHDGQMHARRRLAGREDLLHLRGVLLGVQFFVFVVKLARVPARVSPAALVGGGRVRGRIGHGRL